MYIITDHKNVIIHISETIGYQSNGNVLVDEDSLAIAKPLVKRVYEVAEVPEEVKENKYCYTEEKGFYTNEDYKEPVDENDLQNQITELQLALAELVEGGTK